MNVFDHIRKHLSIVKLCKWTVIINMVSIEAAVQPWQDFFCGRPMTSTGFLKLLLFQRLSLSRTYVQKLDLLFSGPDAIDQNNVLVHQATVYILLLVWLFKDFRMLGQQLKKAEGFTDKMLYFPLCPIFSYVRNDFFKTLFGLWRPNDF